MTSQCTFLGGFISITQELLRSAEPWSPHPTSWIQIFGREGQGGKYLGVPQVLLWFVCMLELQSCCLGAWVPRQSPSCPSKDLWASPTKDVHPLLAIQMIQISLCKKAAQFFGENISRGKTPFLVLSKNLHLCSFHFWWMLFSGTLKEIHSLFWK